ALQIEASRRRQDAATTEVVVEKEAEPDDRPRPQALVVREDEPQGPNDMGGGSEQNLALDERLAHQAKLVIFKVAQAAVDELGRSRGGGAGKVAHFRQKDLQPAALRVTGNAASVDAAADDSKVIGSLGRHKSPQESR